MRLILTLLTVALSSCTLLTRQNVSVEDMGGNLPVLTLSGTCLTVQMSDINLNSALLLYDITTSVNHQQKSVLITAKQALATKNLQKKTKKTFVVDLKKLKISNLESYEYYFQNHDNERIKLSFTKAT